MSRRAREESGPSRSWWRRLAAFVVWYLVPMLIALTAIAYTYGALVWHVDPPAVAVEGTSMLPTLRTGELVFLTPANPGTLKKGDIIAVRVPTQARTTYGLPSNVVHRIVRIERTSGGLVFITKGDNNPGNDVFTTSPSNIVGRLRYVVPGVGFVFLFIQSRSGEIALGALALLGLFYYFFGLLDERRAATREALVALEAALVETQRFEQKLTQLQVPLNQSAPPAAGPDSPAPVIAPEPPIPETVISESVARTDPRLKVDAPVKNKSAKKDTKGKKPKKAKHRKK